MVPPPIYYRLRSKWLAMTPRARAMSICAAVAAVGLCAFAAFRGDPVERAVARGDIVAAKTELKQRQVADSGARTYDAGRIAEAQKSFRVATVTRAARRAAPRPLPWGRCATRARSRR